MGSVTKQHNFAWGEDANPDHVNENFDDVYSFVNTQVIQKDASVAFSAIPSGPALDPTTDNQYSRKKYVDDKTTAVDNKLLTRPTISGDNNQIVKAAEVLVSLDANGEATVTFPTAFPNSLITVMVSNSDIGSNGAGTNGLYGSATVGVSNTGKSKTGFKIRVYDRNTLYGINIVHTNVNFRLAYIAVGT